jgi:hypothetical protein
MLSTPGGPGFNTDLSPQRVGKTCWTDRTFRDVIRMGTQIPTEVIPDYSRTSQDQEGCHTPPGMLAPTSQGSLKGAPRTPADCPSCPTYNFLTKQWPVTFDYLGQLPPTCPGILQSFNFALNPTGTSHCLRGTGQEAHKFYPGQEWLLLPHPSRLVHSNVHLLPTPQSKSTLLFWPQGKFDWLIFILMPWTEPRTLHMLGKHFYH